MDMSNLLHESYEDEGVLRSHECFGPYLKRLYGEDPASWPSIASWDADVYGPCRALSGSVYQELCIFANYDGHCDCYERSYPWARDGKDWWNCYRIWSISQPNYWYMGPYPLHWLRYAWFGDDDDDDAIAVVKSPKTTYEVKDEEETIGAVSLRKKAYKKKGRKCRLCVGTDASSSMMQFPMA